MGQCGIQCCLQNNQQPNFPKSENFFKIVLDTKGLGA